MSAAEVSQEVATMYQGMIESLTFVYCYHIVHAHSYMTAEFADFHTPACCHEGEYEYTGSVF